MLLCFKYNILLNTWLIIILVTLIIAMKPITLIIFLLFQSFYAQTIKDSIFTNVIRIDSNDIIQQGDNYLINTILEPEDKQSLIIFNSTRLSKALFFDYALKNKAFILIMPDWESYDRIAAIATKEKGCFEPATTNWFYQRTYKNGKAKMDSIRYSGEQPEFTFSSSHNSNKNTIVSYLIETFGSSCCEKDPKWDLKNKMDMFIKNYEKRIGKSLGKTYKKITGKEGEHILYYTLSNLNNEQKLNFTLEYYNEFYSKNCVSKYVLSPCRINKNGLELVD